MCLSLCHLFFSLRTVPSDHKRENSGPTLEMERRLELYGGEPHVPCIDTRWNCKEGDMSYTLLPGLGMELLGTRKGHPFFPKSGLCIQRKG